MKKTKSPFNLDTAKKVTPLIVHLAKMPVPKKEKIELIGAFFKGYCEKRGRKKRK